MNQAELDEIWVRSTRMASVTATLPPVSSLRRNDRLSQKSARDGLSIGKHVGASSSSAS